MNKKGVLELQFNWIFVLVAGSLILLFFGSIVLKQKEISDTKLSLNVLTDLQTLTTGSEVSANVYSNITSKGNILTFSCEGCDCYYNLKNIVSPNPVSYNGRTLFAPTTLEGDYFYTFSLDFSMPYKVSNFLYMGSDATRYVIVSEDSLSFRTFIRKLKSLFHQSMWVDTIDSVNAYESDGEDSLRFIFIDTPVLAPTTASFHGFKNQRSQGSITALHIERHTRDDTGDLTFYEYDYAQDIFIQQGRKQVYLGLPSALAAIVVDQEELYRCPFEDAIDRLHYTSELYLNRALDLQAAGIDGTCTTEYLRSTGSGKPLSKIFQKSINPLSRDDARSIYQDAHDPNVGLAYRNSKLQLFSCPEIY